MEVSRAHNIRPSALILGKDSKKAWGKWDFLLAKAYQRFKNEICPQCGLPKYICHNEDNRIQFKVGRDECVANAVAQREQKRMNDNKTEHFGMVVYGDPYLMPDAIKEGLEFSDFRRPYLIEQAKKAGLIPDDFDA